MSRHSAFLLLVLATLGACSSDSSPSTSSSGNPVTTSAMTSVSDPAELARRLKDGGLGCEDFVEEAATDRNEEVDRSGSCTLSSGRTASFDVLLSEERWEHYKSLAGVGCAFFKGQEVPSVTGRWWAAFVDIGLDGKVDTDTTKELVGPLRGKFESYAC